MNIEKKNGRKLALIAFALVMLLSACGKADAPLEAAPGAQEESAPVSGGETPGGAGDAAETGDAGDAADAGGGTAADGSGEDAAEEDSAGGGTPGTEEEPEIVRAMGEFIGLADANSAEIAVNGEPLPFRFAETFDSSFLAELKSGTKLELEYIEQSIEGDDSLKIRTLIKAAVI